MPSARTVRRLEIVEATSPERSSLEEDVASGLRRPFKELPPKHLYDARGCDLFDEICTLDEYYPTRTERAILTAAAHQIIETTGAVELVELGAGSASKTRVLLDAMRDAGQLQRYVPFDIAMAAVAPTAGAILHEYPDAGTVCGVVGDFFTDLDLIPEPESEAPRIVALLGSTIGNFVGAEREQLLSGVAGLLRPQDWFLMGTDLVKDIVVLEAAYNDSRGVTAAFNLNMLEVINRELDADIPVDNFRHIARFETDLEWIEMRLIAQEACRAHIGALDLDVEWDAGEEMRTEISAKFTPERIALNLETAGLALTTLFTDAQDHFGLSLSRPAIGGERADEDRVS